VTLTRGRIYILPTRLGIAFGVMLFAMLLGSLNYGNNLGLALTFLLASLALVTMHACHRNLDGLTVSGAGTDPPFAGQAATFRLGLRNPSVADRLDVEVATDSDPGANTTVRAEADARLDLHVPTRRRGHVRLARCEIATRYPFGLFRAWAVLHPDTECLVYPRPAEHAPPPPRAGGGDGGDAGRGEDDFAGLKHYHPGDPPRRIAWKAHARGGELLVKEFAGAAASTPVFDLDTAPGADLETRLEIMTRWVLDAHRDGKPFGLRLPGLDIDPDLGDAQRRRCLAALACHGLPDDADA